MASNPCPCHLYIDSVNFSFIKQTLKEGRMTMKPLNLFRHLAVITAVISMAASTIGCTNKKVVDRARFQFSDNLEVAQFSLIFSKDIQAQFGGVFAIKNYGDFFINPWTNTAPFEVGFNLNWTQIVNDQDYVHLQPTLVLPNGEPTELGPVVEVRPEQPVNKNFDVFGYVDVANTSWLGVAVILNVLTSDIFPTDLSMRSVFMKDSTGKPVIYAKVFGPTTKPDGSPDKPGGLAAFGNIRYLAENRISRIDLAPGNDMTIEGKNADYYRSHPEILIKIQDDVIHAINNMR